MKSPGAEKVHDLEVGVTFRTLGAVEHMPELQGPSGYDYCSNDGNSLDSGLQM